MKMVFFVAVLACAVSLGVSLGTGSVAFVLLNGAFLIVNLVQLGEYE